MRRNCKIYMNSFFCKYCQTNKLFSEFNKCNYTKTGYQYKCRKCEKKYKQNNFIKIQIKNKQYIICNKEKYKQKSKEYRDKNKTKIKLQKIEYLKKNKEKIAKKSKEWRLRTKDARKAYKKQYYENHKEQIIKYNIEYRKNNLDWYKKYQREYTKNKRATDPHYKILHRLRNRLLIAIKKDKGSKTISFQELVGCDIKTLKNHIQSKFIEGMNWEKFINGEIVLDHILPCCSFDLIKIEEQKKCFHYTNLQPLWKKDNLNKIKNDFKIRNENLI